MHAQQEDFLQQKKVIKAKAELFWNEGRLRMTIPKAIRDVIDGLDDQHRKCSAILELCSDIESFRQRAEDYVCLKVIPLYFVIAKRSPEQDSESRQTGEKE